MAAFTMCPACQREYDDPHDRRFHAEPNACPVCGPQLRLTDPARKHAGGRPRRAWNVRFPLCRGGIVAVKGVGGFHLMTDATDETAVAELRRRKHREEKPFAVMFRDLAMLREWAEVSAAAETLLKSPQCPIVLVPKRPDRALAAGVAPDNPVARRAAAIVATAPSVARQQWIARSSPPAPTSPTNRSAPTTTRRASGSPASRIFSSATTAPSPGRSMIPSCASLPAARPSCCAARAAMRRRRWNCPPPCRKPIICVGAQMKNTVAVASGRRLVLSPHIGDLGGSATHRVFTRTIDTLGSLLAAKPAAVVCDKHPDYQLDALRHRQRTAADRRAASPRPCARGFVRARHPADGVLGVAWDGTGYGEDGTIWGGEFILLQDGRASRFARLRPFRLPGGEAAVRDARRVAVALAGASAGSTWRRVSASADTSRHPASDVGPRTELARLLQRRPPVRWLRRAAGTRHAQFLRRPDPARRGSRRIRCLAGWRVAAIPRRPAAEGANWEIDWSAAIASC